MWETATNLACVAFCASLAQPLFPKESAEQPSLSSQLHLLSCRRVSEAGHILDNFFERFGVEWMQQAIDQHCTLQVIQCRGVRWICLLCFLVFWLRVCGGCLHTL